MFIYHQWSVGYKLQSPFNCSPMLGAYIQGDSNGISSDLAPIVDLTQNKNDLQIYPNPTSGWVHVNRFACRGGICPVDVMNNMGQRVVSLPSVSTQFNLGAVANGVYLLSFRDLQTGQVFHKKLIKTTQ